MRSVLADFARMDLVRDTESPHSSVHSDFIREKQSKLCVFNLPAFLFLPVFGVHSTWQTLTQLLAGHSVSLEPWARETNETSVARLLKQQRNVIGLLCPMKPL